MTTQPRARKGGEIGVNGLFYPGGSFIPSTKNGKQPKGKKRQGTGKQEIEPWVWAIPPMGYVSIFKRLNCMTDQDIKTPNLTACAYYKVDPEMIQNYINQYNLGKRWIVENSAPYDPLEIDPTGEYLTI